MKNLFFGTAPNQLWLIVLSFLLPAYFCAQIVSIPTNVWVQKIPTYVGAPNGGKIFPQGWNNKGAYDPESKRTIACDRWYDTLRDITIYANALLAYEPFTNIVTVVKATNWQSQLVLCSDGSPGCGITGPTPQNASDPTPVDRHPLGGVALAPYYKTLYLTNGLNQGAPGGHPRDTWEFNLNTGSWSIVSNDSTLGPNPPNDPGAPLAMTYDSANKKIVCFTQKNSAWEGTETWLLDPSTKKWSVVTQDSTSLHVNTSASGIAYDSKRGRILTFGGGYAYNGISPNLWAYSVVQNKWTALADCPKSAGAPGFDYDSKNDVFLALIDTTTWVYDPTIDTWSEIQTPIDRSYLYKYQSVTYNVAQDVFVFQGGTWSAPKWALFRYDKSVLGINNPVTLVNIDVCPNPNTGTFKLNINHTRAEEITISIFDVTGKSIFAEVVETISGSTLHEINLSKYAKGVYTLKAMSSTGITNKKIIVQ